jgi:SSS family solute:Na+ symporter
MTTCFPLALLSAGTPNAQPILSMHAVDFLIIAVYFVVVLAIGFYLKRYTKTGEDFFMAGRDITAWVAGLSFICANLGALELMGWAA